MENQFTYTSPESVGLPPGYKFLPTKKELIHFLIKKINGVPIPHNPVKDCDIYGDPKIWTKPFEETRMKTLYFYTKLKHRQTGMRVRRSSEFGTWDGQKDFRIYDDDEEEDRNHSNERKAKHIGSRRSFSFVETEGLEHNVGWSMLEYRLDGINQNIPNEDGYVICQINKNPKDGRPTRDNSHQNIQVEGAQPLDEDWMIIQDDGPQPLDEEWIHQNEDWMRQTLQDDGAQPSDEDWMHQIIQDDGEQPLDKNMLKANAFQIGNQFQEYF